MPNLYVRSTALPDVCGRVDYISNPDRQERLLAVYDNTTNLLDGQFWKVLAKESQQAFELYGQKSRLIRDRKTGAMIEQKLHCCQGRENVIQLPNSLRDRMDDEQIAKRIAWEYKKKLGLDVIVAVHYNAKENNLHAHVIFPERQLLQAPVIKIAERNLFFDADGRRRYKKAEILDENKQLLPGCRIVKKGEIYEQHYFSAVDPEYSYKKWTANIKTNVILPLLNGELRGDVEITEYDPSTGKLAQQHIGVVDRVDWPSAKAKVADIRKYNNLVKEFNQLIDSNRISLDEALAVQFEVNHLAEKTATLEARLMEFRHREIKREEAAAKEPEDPRWYFQIGWMRDANIPYKVYKYDRNGRKRSTIELIVILAAVIIDNECKKLGPPEPAAEISSRTIYAKRDKKIQAMVDAVRVAREESIQTVPEIGERLKQVGANLNRARSEAARLTGSIQKMETVMQAIRDFDALHQKCERILNMPECLDKNILLAQEAANLERYRQAKANMYQMGVAAPEGRQAFLERYSLIDENLQRANQSCEELKEQYRRLSKLKYSVEMAQIKQYCYDPDWEPETVTQQETQLDVQKQEAQLQHRLEDAPTDPGDR